MNKILSSLILSVFLTIGCTNTDTSSSYGSLQVGKDFPVYGGNKAGNRYSPLDQIDLKNVKNLEVAWTYNAADPGGEGDSKGKQIQCQPIVVDGTLYATSPELELFALDAKNGKQLWRFSFGEYSGKHNINANRGVTYFENGSDKRILYTVGHRLFSVNAENGTLNLTFGRRGVVDLREDLISNDSLDYRDLVINATSPGIVYRNLFILGSSVSETGNAAPGHVRAFDILTGKRKWIFHTIPKPGEPGYDTWPPGAYNEVGGANSWSGISLDEDKGVVYLGTGSPASDFYGGNREGKNLYGNCVLALEADSGSLKWYYQTIQHDLWDRDLPSPPNLSTINFNGEQRDVAVQATKDGLIYVLDREDGTSLFPVQEKPVPTNGLPGEIPWPTQKYPVKPLPLSNQVFKKADITNISPEAHNYVANLVADLDFDHKFTLPNTKGTLLYGYSGGAEWGGNAIDPDGILYQNANNDPWILQMIDTLSQNKQFSSLSKENALYLKNCAACHGTDRKGNGSDFPSLVNIEKKLSKSALLEVLNKGSGRMPSFSHIPEKDRRAIADYLLGLQQVGHHPEDVSSPDSKKSTKTQKKKKFGFRPRYVTKAWKKLTDQDGYPGIKPPWGTLNAIDLKTGDYLWRVPLGEYPELADKGIERTGTENYGGPVVTGGGLVFIAGTMDEKIRAFNKETGRVVWEYQLPAGGFATPITYSVDGKQYVVIAAGGGRGQKPGGKYVAFTLPD